MTRSRKKLERAASPIESTTAVTPPPAPPPQAPVPSPSAPARKIELIITTRRQAAKAQQQEQINKVDIAPQEQKSVIETRSRRVPKTESLKIKERVQVRKCVFCFL